MRTEINRVLATYSADDLKDDTGKAKAATDIRDALRKLFNETEFIYSVGFSDFVIVPMK